MVSTLHQRDREPRGTNGKAGAAGAGSAHTNKRPSSSWRLAALSSSSPTAGRLPPKAPPPHPAHATCALLSTTPSNLVWNLRAAKGGQGKAAQEEHAEVLQACGEGRRTRPPVWLQRPHPGGHIPGAPSGLLPWLRQLPRSHCHPVLLAPRGRMPRASGQLQALLALLAPPVPVPPPPRRGLTT